MPDSRTDEYFLAALTAAADDHAARVLAGVGKLLASAPHHRRVMESVLALVTCHAHRASRHHSNPEVLAGADRLLAHLAATQGDDGLFDGENLASPPDTAFTVNDVCDAFLITSSDPAAAGLAVTLEKIALAARDSLLHGGVHTPNHRWELCAALARLHRNWADERLQARIDEWLAEGIDIGPDGLYSERSPNYAAHVSNPALITIGQICDRPDLLDAVCANLDATIATSLPDGTVETVASRRQDQHDVIRLDAYLMQFRRLAIARGRGDYAAVVGEILARPPRDPAAALAEVLLAPELAAPLPSAVPRASSRRLLPSARLVVIRDGRWSLSVYGGSDYARHGRIRSGLANNPTFLRLVAGDAVLDAVRLTRDFFGVGPFRAADLVDGHDTILLTEEICARYYGPLPVEHQRADGAYRLADEGRFSASMDFAGRPANALTLATDVRVRPDGHDVSVDVCVSAGHVGHTLVLTFRPGGTLTGTSRSAVGAVLTDAGATYRCGDDTIAISADSIGDRVVPYHPGEDYTLLRGTDSVAGVTVHVPVPASGHTTLRLSATVHNGPPNHDHQPHAASRLPIAPQQPASCHR